MPSKIQNDKYKDVTIKGSTFTGDPYKLVPVTKSKELVEEYIPAINKCMADSPRGFRILLTAMTDMEGFTKKSRSYRTNNPGNIGNVDDGRNNVVKTLEDGILLQKSYIEKILAGKNKNYPLGRKVVIPPFYSKEIANNPSYGLPPYLPGYEFTFTGQLDQFVKIYSTGARVTNVYINNVVSFFEEAGIKIKPDSLLQDIIKTQ